MRFLPTLFNRQAAGGAVERKSYATEIGGFGALLSSLRDPRRSWPVERAVAEGYERVIWVFKSVDAIATQAAKVPFQITVPGPDGETVPVEDDPLVTMLNSGRANKLETGRQFRERLSGQVLLSRRGAFVEVTESRRGQIIGADLLPPGKTRPVPGADGDLLSHYETITADGRRVAIDPAKVRWFRKVHPLDPFAAMTPLEAAGLSVDLDFLARLYNATFLRNDGRPGGVIGIDGEVDDGEMERIQGIFGKGALEAGKLAVLQGDVKYLEVGARPRDMAYADLARISKEEILAAFGVPESVIGNASGRTWDNASQEEDNFWQFTMDGHLSLLATGWDDDAGEGGKAGWDLSDVPAFQRIQQRARQEAREEFAAGLISVDEYRVKAGYDPIDTPHSRALYVAQGKTPIPGSPDDAEALGLAPPTEEGAGNALPPGGSTTGATGPAGELPAAPKAGEAEAMARLQALIDDDQGAPDAAPPADAQPAGREGKALPVAPASPAAAIRDQLADDLEATLARLADRLVNRSAARVLSPKHRKGTRHWVSEFPVDTRAGSDRLDADRIVPGAQWEAEARTAVAPLLVSAARAAAELVTERPLDETAGDDVDMAALEVTDWLVGEFKGAVAAAKAAVVNLDSGGWSAERIAAQVGSLTWQVDGAAERAATALTAAAGTAAAASLVGGQAVRVWRARDEQHKGVDLQAQPGDEPFHVGGVLRWPGDVQAADADTAGCRCLISYILPAQNH